MRYPVTTTVDDSREGSHNESERADSVAASLPAVIGPTVVDDVLSVEPGAVLQRGRAVVGPRDSTVRLIRAKRRRTGRRRRRDGLLLALAGAILVGTGAGLLVAHVGSSSNSSKPGVTKPVALVVSGQSTVLSGKAQPGSTVEIVIFSLPVRAPVDATGTWRLPVPLSPGINRFSATYTDEHGQKVSTVYTVTRVVTTTPSVTPATTTPPSSAPTTIPVTTPVTTPVIVPVDLALSVTSPPNGTHTPSGRVFVIGKATAGATITGAGLTTTADPTGAWSLSITLFPGANHLQFTATAPNASPKTIDLLILSGSTTTAAPTTIPQPTTTVCCPPDTGP